MPPKEHRESNKRLSKNQERKKRKITVDEDVVVVKVNEF